MFLFFVAFALKFAFLKAIYLQYDGFSLFDFHCRATSDVKLLINMHTSNSGVRKLNAFTISFPLIGLGEKPHNLYFEHIDKCLEKYKSTLLHGQSILVSSTCMGLYKSTPTT